MKEIILKGLIDDWKNEWMSTERWRETERGRDGGKYMDCKGIEKMRNKPVKEENWKWKSSLLLLVCLISATREGKSMNLWSDMPMTYRWPCVRMQLNLWAGELTDSDCILKYL